MRHTLHYKVLYVNSYKAESEVSRPPAWGLRDEAEEVEASQLLLRSRPTDD